MTESVMLVEKICGLCNRSLPESQFRLVERWGHTIRYTYCRDCERAYDRRRYELKPHKRRGRDKPKGGDKDHARSLLQAAVRRGYIERKSCEVCGAKAQAHHDDHGKPYDIRWLCPKHHAEVHRQELPRECEMAARRALAP